MTDSHHHGQNDYNRLFAVCVSLNLLFVAVEAVFGLWADSLALLADAGHNLSDVISLLLAWGASRLVKIRSSNRRTYGWRNSSIMVALINALLLLMTVAVITWEAIQRLKSPVPVQGWTMVVVAGIGVVINTVTAWLFMSGRKSDLNIRGAFLHMAADAGVSLGVVLAGLGILVWGALWIDPVVSLALAVVIFVSTWGLLRDSVNLALQAVPKEIDLASVKYYLLSLPGVTSVHDLHIWALSTTEVALTAHLVKPDPTDDDEVVRQASQGLRDRFGIGHTTIQWEREEICQDNVCGGK